MANQWDKGKLRGWVDKEKTLSYINATAPIAASESKKEFYDAANVIRNYDNSQFEGENIVNSEEKEGTPENATGPLIPQRWKGYSKFPDAKLEDFFEAERRMREKDVNSGNYNVMGNIENGAVTNRLYALPGNYESRGSSVTHSPDKYDNLRMSNRSAYTTGEGNEDCRYLVLNKLLSVISLTLDRI